MKKPGHWWEILTLPDASKDAVKATALTYPDLLRKKYNQLLITGTFPIISKRARLVLIAKRVKMDQAKYRPLIDFLKDNRKLNEHPVWI